MRHSNQHLVVTENVGFAVSHLIIVEEQAVSALTLTVNREGVGGLSGLAPTVAIRQASAPDSYLDWDDGAFKTTGWTTKYQSMSESERGTYQRLLDLSAVTGAPVGTLLIVEYRVIDGTLVGDDHDLLMVVSVNTDTILLRKALTNKMIETPGLPGSLVLYDDDDTTPLLSQELRDFAAGATIGVQGSPAQRTKAT